MQLRLGITAFRRSAFARANKARSVSSAQGIKLFLMVRLQQNNAFHPAQSRGVRRPPLIPFKCPEVS